jgi:hypothetical protein
LLFVQKNIFDYRLKELLFGIYTTASDTNIKLPGITQEQIKSNLDTLYKFLTESNLVPKNVSDKIINYKNQKNLKQITMLDEYDFYPNKDSFGEDIGFFPNKSIEELEEIAELYPDCAGFNSWGYLKHLLHS